MKFSNAALLFWVVCLILIAFFVEADKDEAMNNRVKKELLTMASIILLNVMLIVTACCFSTRYPGVVKYYQLILYLGYSTSWLISVIVILGGEQTDHFSYPTRVYIMLLFCLGAMTNQHSYVAMVIVRWVWTGLMYIMAKQFMEKQP